MKRDVDAGTPNPLSLCPEIVQVCANFNLRRAARAVSQFYDGALQGSGLRSTQFSMLVAIHENGPLTVNNLGNGMVMDQTTVSRNLRVLQKQGYVAMVPGTDRRTRAVSITKKGTNVLRDAIPSWKKAQAHMTTTLGEKRMQQLFEGLQAATTIARGV